jgi:opacity protein-like surface antigen
MIKRLIIVSALIAAMATPALAGQLGEPTIRAGHWDFSLQTRYTSSHDYDGPDGSSVSFNDDLGWGFGFGYNVNDRFSAGFLMSWRTVSYNATAVDATDATNTVNYSNWLDTGTIAATGTWNLLPKRFTPYVNGAIGWTMFDSNVASGIQTGCWYDPWWGYVCSNYATTYGTDAFSYAVGAGLRLEASGAFFVRVGYEYDGADLDNFDGINVFRVDAGLTY